MRKTLYVIGIAAPLAVMAASAARAASGAADWFGAPANAEAFGRPVPRDRPVAVTSRESPLAAVAEAERAIVFVFAADCEVCHVNMANWTELVRTLRGREVALIALSPREKPGAREYWRELGRRVRVVTAPAEEIRAALGVESTPATLMVSRGRVRAEALGTLSAAAWTQFRLFGEGHEDR